MDFQKKGKLSSQIKFFILTFYKSSLGPNDLPKNIWPNRLIQADRQANYIRQFINR